MDKFNGRMAQRLERSVYTRKVPGLNPGAPTMEIKIVYEDEDLVVLNKPSGLLTHPANRKDASDSVVGWLLSNYPEITKVKDAYSQSLGQWVDLRPGIVHRLDKETSGLMIAAKNQTAFDYLKNQFQQRKINKTYLALVRGLLKDRSGVIEKPLAKLGAKQTVRLRGKKELVEKTAVTEYKVLKSYGSRSKTDQDYQLLEISPKTGRMHQIRVHLQSIGHSVVCDSRYDKKYSCPPALGRLFLHAQKLSFTTPSGKALTLETDLPPKLEQFLKTLKKSTD